MTPEPTPVSGMAPDASGVVPPTVIRTTAGLTLAATSMVAEDSSMVTGLVVPTLLPWPVVGMKAPPRSSAPLAPRTRTVPPAARTADRSETARIEPIPVCLRVVPPLDGVTAATGAGVAGAGSNQRSGVVGAGASSVFDHSGRLSG